MLNAFGSDGQRLRGEGHGPHKPPESALVNNGAEETKGTPDLRARRTSCSKTNARIHFAGNVEPRDIPDGEVDVVVCDGFTSATWSSS